MSYEYLLGIGAEDEDVFELGVQVAAPKTRKQPQTAGGQQAERRPPTREEIIRRTQEACGGIGCPEGLGKKRNFIIRNPVRLAELQEGMDGQGCSLLCTVGNSHTYCCPSAIEVQEVVTDPFAIDPMALEVVETSIAETPTASSTAFAPADGNGSSRLGLVAIFGILGLGTIGVIGFLALRKKRKKKKGKKKS